MTWEFLIVRLPSNDIAADVVADVAFAAVADVAAAEDDDDLSFCFIPGAFWLPSDSAFKNNLT